MHFFELMKNRFQDFLRKSLNLSKSNVNNTFGKTNLDNGLFFLLSEDLLFSISVAAAEIMGGREVHVEAGSTLNLTCVVRNQGKANPIKMSKTLEPIEFDTAMSPCPAPS